jgi:glutaconyl-CoA/methylmalonyl-CoA decarboxylase subunit delta
MRPDILLLLGNLAGDHLTIVLVGYVVVFLSLSLLWALFQNLPRILNLKFRKSEKKAEAEVAAVERKGDAITGEETAAISAALFLFIEELHDDEHTVLTIEKISRRYSPWSSKIYSVTNGLNKRF